jgi:hypothetical protein
MVVRFSRARRAGSGWGVAEEFAEEDFSVGEGAAGGGVGGDGAEGFEGVGVLDY